MKKVSPTDMWVMLLSTVRYSMGRMTYMSEWAGELVVKYNQYLTAGQLAQIAEEIEKELKFAEQHGQYLGMDIDHRAWKKNLEAIRGIDK